jgi:hypothetical protein
MKQYMTLSFCAVAVLVLFLIIVYSYEIREKFNEDCLKTVHKNIPVVQPDAIRTIQGLIINVINNRPDTIETIKQIVQEPTINKTLMDILFTSNDA